jgi:4-hydroxyphenylpyruvate dioxygenase-like putative hemolysin
MFASASAIPLGIEIAFVVDDVSAAHTRALGAGAIELAVPEPKPWGLDVSYVRCQDGTLVALCSAMA